jgi:hypothetical protein
VRRTIPLALIVLAACLPVDEMVQSVEGTVELGGPCVDSYECKPGGCNYGPDVTFCTSDASGGVCACPKHFRDEPDGV